LFGTKNLWRFILIPGNTDLIKQINETRVLNIIRQKVSISRVSLAKLTALNPSTVTDIITRLTDQGAIEEVGMGNSTGGRKPQMIRLNPKSFLYAGVYIHKHVYCILMDIYGQVYSKMDFLLSDPEKLTLSNIAVYIRKVAEQAGVPISNLRGIGMGFPGQVDSQYGIVKFAPHINWQNVAIKEFLEKELQASVFVDNGMKATALGECWFGAEKGLSDFVLLNISDGIGSALVINNRIYRGLNQQAGELGHNYLLGNISPAGTNLCRCGKKGCLETVASQRAIVERFVNAAGADPETNTPDILNKIFLSWKNRKEPGCEIIDQAAFYLGITIANILNFLDPQKIIITGSVVEAGGDEFLARVLEFAKEHTFGFIDSSRVIISSLGPYRYAIGAATLGMHHLFKAGIQDNDDLELMV
jgi:predicted NBD/HSP70 family sugar kinase